MKYLKYSAIILAICVLCSVGFTYAYATNEVPVSFTKEISYVTRENSPTRNKINDNLQKVKVGMTTASSDATFAVQFYWSGGKVETISHIGTNSVRTSSNGLTREQGEVYIKVWRDDAMIGTKKATGFTYDPNALSL